MYAVEFDRFDQIVFSVDPPPADRLGVLRDRFGGRLRQDVDLEEPQDLNDWTAGAERPAPVLCVSVNDPNRYQVLKFPRLLREEDGKGFGKDGRRYALLSPGVGWRMFVDHLVKLDDIAKAEGQEAGDMDDAQALPASAWDNGIR